MALSGCFGKPLLLGLVFGVVVLVETATVGYLSWALRSFERHFQLTGRLTGLLAAAGDIGFLLGVFFFVFWGWKGRKGSASGPWASRTRWLGLAGLLVVIGCLLGSGARGLGQGTPFPPEEPELTTGVKALAPLEVGARQYFSRPAVQASNPLFFEAVLVNPCNESLVTRIAKLMQEKQAAQFSDFFSDFLGDSKPDATTTPPPPTLSPLGPKKMEIRGRPLKQRLEEIDLRGMVRNGSLNCFPEFENVLRDYLNISKPRLLMAAAKPFSFCHSAVNEIKGRVVGRMCAADAANAGAVALFFIGALVAGIGRSALWCLGLPLFDDLASPLGAPVYFGIIVSLRTIGQIIGYFLGITFFKVYFNLGEPPVGVNFADYRWVGAWWLGYIVIGVILLVPSILLALSPDRRRSAQQGWGATNRALGERKDKAIPLNRREDLPESSHGDASAGGLQLGDFFASLIHLFKIPLVRVIIAAWVLEVFAFKGFYDYLPSFLNVHYGVPLPKIPPKIMFVMVGFLIGTIFGTIALRFFKLDGRRAAFWIIAWSLVAVVLSFSQLGVGCESVNDVAGKMAKANGFNLTEACNDDCLCDPTTLSPVCDSAGNVFFSPCHAGCRNFSRVGEFQLDFFDCLCAVNETASREVCSDDCHRKASLFVVMTVLSAAATGVSAVASLLVFMRAVPPRLRSPALGLAGFLMTLIGLILSPLVYGYVVDGACTLWNQNCPAKVTCAVYDTAGFRQRLTAFNGVLKLAAFAFYLLVWLRAKNLHLFANVLEVTNAADGNAYEEVDKKPTHGTKSQHADGSD